MEASQPLGTLGRTRLGFANTEEIDEFVSTLEKYEKGEISADQWRVFRLLRGTYGQRQPDVQMIRVKIPQGILDVAQLRALADVAEANSRGFGHITTRQNVQFHFVPTAEVEGVMRRLGQVGLTTREACGSSVRNVTACPYAGISQNEVFDVTPYAEEFTRYFLRHPLGSALPRKFKVAFEGCPEDHAFAAINDIGWTARLRDGRRGFRVTVGGGTAILCRSGAALQEFLPAGEMLALSEAILRTYQRLGDFKHKQRNRMKFLIKEMGFEAWRGEVLKEFLTVLAAGGVPLSFDPDHAKEEQPPTPRATRLDQGIDQTAREAQASPLKGPGILPRLLPEVSPDKASYVRWRGSNVRPQKQDGYEAVTITVPLGDVTAQQLRLFATLAEASGDESVRTTPEQNLLLRWVRKADVESVYRLLAATGLGLSGASSAADVVSCPGAETCRIAVTQSRGLGRLLGDDLRERPELVAATGPLDIKVSGCPNGCGQHHVAGIGFQGSVRRVGGKALPQYFVMVGGGITNGVAEFGRLVAKIPARRVPLATRRLLDLYLAERAPDELAAAFFRRVEPARVTTALKDLEAFSAFDASPLDFIDPGEDAAYRPEVMDGECSA